MPTLTLIDGSGFIFRAYHALPALSNAQGVPAGAVYGFVNMLLKLMESNRTDYVAVVFDAARHTFRNRIYADYKAHRPPPPDDLIPQFALVREATDALNIPRVEMADYEADDLIATYARLGVEAGMEVVVLSSDKDLMQLIRNGVRLHDPMKDKPIGPEQVTEKFGVEPARVRDVLALIGDTSDNVPGVPGIGPKTAAELILQFGDLEKLLSRLDEIKQPKRRETLQAHADKARLSYELIGLMENVPVPCPLEDLALKPLDGGKLQQFLQAQGFKALALRMKGKLGEAQATEAEPAARPLPATATASYALVQDEAELARWVAEARERGVVAIDTETTSLDAMRAELVGFSLALGAGRACYVPVGHVAPGAASQSQAGADLFAAPVERVPGPKQIGRDAALAMLKPLLEDEAVLKIGHNIKYDALVLKRYGIETKAADDTMLLSYLLSAGVHGQGMDELAERYLQYKTITYDELTGTGRARVSFAEVELEKACDYAAEDADITYRLWEYGKPRVAAARMLTLYETIERPLVPVLVNMEQRGIRVDAGVLHALSAEFARKMALLEAEIHQLAGHPFNVGSPKQLGEVLFDEQQLPGGRKSSKTGTWSTDAYVLEELAEQGYPIAVRVMEWRQLSKLKGTYTDALPAQIHPQTGRVHTSFAMAATTTGRLSSSDPNLQNIPIRTTEGKKIRHAFVAAPGNKLISADYSQIELRLLAHMADIPTLKAAFKNGDDIHAITAAQMFGLAPGAVDADLRRKAKTINFGIIYGISAHGLATRLGIGRAEAATYIEQYFRQYPGIRDYMEAKKEEARASGYVTTLYGRRCHLPTINDKNGARRQFAERQAINAPLQGTAADIIKRAMIAVERDLQKVESARMLLQVHDELVFEVREDEAQAALAVIKPAMEKAAHLSVPLVVEAGVGDNWGEIH